jgi:hypothetical protein
MPIFVMVILTLSFFSASTAGAVIQGNDRGVSSTPTGQSSITADAQTRQNSSSTGNENTSQAPSNLVWPAELSASIEASANSAGSTGNAVGLTLTQSTLQSETNAVYTGYLQIAALPYFDQLYSLHGHPSFVYQTTNNMSGALESASFGFAYLGANESITTVWTVNPFTGLVVGPTNSTAPPATATYASHNWAGYEFYGSGTPQLQSAISDQYFVYVKASSTSPSNVPSGTTVDQVFSVWSGLDDANGGSGNLAQDGYITDATHCGTPPCKGEPFYEFYCPSLSGCMPTIGTWGTFTSVSFNDNVVELVRWSGYPGLWQFQVKDYTTLATANGWFEVIQNGSGPLPSGYHPDWSVFIDEAYSNSGLIQQISYFQDEDFYDITVCASSGTCYDGINLSNTPFQLGQACSQWYLGIYGFSCLVEDQNAADQYWGSGYTGGYWGETGYSAVTGHDSDYDYNCVTGADPC